MEQQYCLKWNNHPKNIATVFDRLREEELFVDVTLATADRQVRITTLIGKISVLGIRIRMFLGLQDPDPLVTTHRYGSGSGSFPFLK